MTVKFGLTEELETGKQSAGKYLISGGIEAGDVVAIYAHRSAALVLAILGVLKAGGVFVILDPASPSARLIDYLGIARPGLAAVGWRWRAARRSCALA